MSLYCNLHDNAMEMTTKAMHNYYSCPNLCFICQKKQVDFQHHTGMHCEVSTYTILSHLTDFQVKIKVPLMLQQLLISFTIISKKRKKNNKCRQVGERQQPFTMHSTLCPSDLTECWVWATTAFRVFTVPDWVFDNKQLNTIPFQQYETKVRLLHCNKTFLRP